MIHIIYHYFQRRISWLVLAIITLILESIALYMQYIILLKPCLLCIYQRYTLYGLLIASFIGIIAPKNIMLRLSSLIIWIYSSVQGLFFAIKHTNMQLSTSKIINCESFTKYSNWIPLNKLLSSIITINNSNYCNIQQWYFVSLKLPPIMIIIFSFYLIIAILILGIECISYYKKNF
ncbi:Disulfide bond formation protein B [Candidatus Mikella endobia]|uniref:Disulfide bond formation protein B n=1 Tax=Candidatus Mikella endobia TaxID=1778264 RepID=A0A143WQ01_9ENTR|nr:disulfide bond formation protein DsbB [Candidatus Mikella endobia]CUX95802.1 Disulfide bond formation protein B [Candidatus Mikella endobia]